MRTGEQHGTWSWAGFGVAAGVTVLLLGAVEAGLVQLAVQKKARDARRGWNLQPVVRFTRDLPERTALGPGDVEVSLLPEQFVTDSVVTPADLPRLAGRKLYPQVMKGDVAIKAMFDQPRLGPACVALVEEEARGLGVAQDEGVRELVEAVRAEAGGAR